jgi:hypothetical protein
MTVVCFFQGLEGDFGPPPRQLDCNSLILYLLQRFSTPAKWAVTPPPAPRQVGIVLIETL